MIHKVEATYDGEIVRPEEPLHLAPNSRFVMTYESVEQSEASARAAGEESIEDTPETVGSPEARTASWTERARSLNLDGPSDLSVRLHEYLYGDLAHGAE